MSEQLWLRLPRRVVAERGYGITHVPGDVRGALQGTHEIDPLTGYACCPVSYEMRGVYGWQTNGAAEWVLAEPFLRLDGEYEEAVCHRAATAFSLTTAASAAAGGFFFGFIAYGNGSPFDLWFGGGWRLRFETGSVSLYTTDPAAPAASGQLWSPEDWEARLHLLYVYAVGDRLCARRIGTAGATPAGGTIEGLLAVVPVAAGGTPLPAARLTVRGTGYLTFGAAPARHGRSLVVRHELMRLPEPLRSAPTVSTATLTPPGSEVTAELFNATGLAMDSAEPPHTGFRYQVSASLLRDTGPNLYLTRVRVAFPQVVEDDGQEGVDLMGLAPAGLGGEPGTVKAVELRRGLDPEGAGLTIELGTAIDQVAPYIQPHMRGRWVVDGVSQAVFYTSRPSLSPQLHHETLRVDCELGWKLLKAARCGGDLALAGQRLGAAYREVARRAGLADEEIATTGNYRLPVETPDGESQFDIRPEMTLAEVLSYLRDQFAAADRIYVDPAGVLRIGPQPGSASGAVFRPSPTEPEELRAVAAGAPPVPRIREGSWSEEFEEGGFANEVAVVGEDRERRPLVAVATDWPSIHGYRDGEGEVTGFPFNYVAEFRRMIIIDGALTSQALVNWVARTVLQRVRLLRLRARFESSYVALTPGDLVEVEGRGLWRLMGLTRRSDGPWTDRATYEVEQELG